MVSTRAQLGYPRRACRRRYRRSNRPVSVHISTSMCSIFHSAYPLLVLLASTGRARTPGPRGSQFGCCAGISFTCRRHDASRCAGALCGLCVACVLLPAELLRSLLLSLETVSDFRVASSRRRNALRALRRGRGGQSGRRPGCRQRWWQFPKSRPDTRVALSAMDGDDAALALEQPEDATSSLADELPAGQCVTRAARHRWVLEIEEYARDRRPRHGVVGAAACPRRPPRPAHP